MKKQLIWGMEVWVILFYKSITDVADSLSM